MAHSSSDSVAATEAISAERETIGYDEIAQLAREHGSPLYLFEPAIFRRNVNDLTVAFRRQYPRILVGYSYKTNHIPYVCRLARELGARAEVVSRLEVDLALRVGCPPEEIIFNGPLKTDEDLDRALSSGMLVNLDNRREVERVIAFARSHPAPIRIGLRINIELTDADGKSHLQEGLATGRFGLSPADLEATARDIERVANVRVVSLHGHASSTCRSPWAYRTIARTLVEAGARFFAETIEYINIGGGYFGPRSPAMGMVDTPTYADYAEAVGAELRRDRWIEARHPVLVIEPGMAVVADAMSFVTRVFEIKEIGERRLAVVDGTVFNVKPTLHKRNHPFTFVPAESGRERRGRYDVVGATCMEKDCLLQGIECGEVKRGDYFRIGNVGAYTIVLTPPFIHPAPPILAREDAGYRLVRRRQEFADVFGTYTF